MKKVRLKRFYLHPITTYLLLILLVFCVSFVLHIFKLQTTYSIININTLKVEQITSEVSNLLSFNEIKNIVSNTTKNFVSFAPLCMYLVAAIGLAVCESSGFLDMLFKRVFSKIPNKWVTFLIILISTISSIINEVGFVLLIPIAALIYKSKKRNPMAGVVAAFAGTSFGYGTTIFFGSIDALMIPYTRIASRIIDPSFYVNMSSNLFIMIISTIVLSIVGTLIMERRIIPKLGGYKEKKEETNDDIEVIDEKENIEQEALSNDFKEKRGFKWASIAGVILIVFFIYCLIPNLPLSGMLLDMTKNTYLDQVFGDSSYFQDGFTFLVSILLLIIGLVYGIGSHKFKNDRDIINSTNDSLKNVGYMVGLLFVASQFVAIFRYSNIGNVIIGVLSNLLGGFSFGGIPFLIISCLIFIISDFFVTGVQAKWAVFAPVVIPTLMQTNIAPAFVQFVMRACDSVMNGISPLYAYFVIYVGYMNIYNNKTNKPVTIGECIRIIFPYFLIITATWLLLLIGWYIIGLPIGPGVFPTL
ncbi:MAG: AbgT family transporter [Bacilli bacterium]|nr:AbgT family transporter [Bacilli bacterium]